jgi:hypothetical protein
LYEYQRKGLTKFAFRNSLILKGAILVVLGLQAAEIAPWEKKSGSKLPHIGDGLPKLKTARRVAPGRRISGMVGA